MANFEVGDRVRIIQMPIDPELATCRRWLGRRLPPALLGKQGIVVEVYQDDGPWKYDIHLPCAAGLVPSGLEDSFEYVRVILRDQDLMIVEDKYERG